MEEVYSFAMDTLTDYADVWANQVFVGFDLETSGKYPVESEICEMAAVKYQNGVVIDTYQTLVKPSKPMGQEVINIHGITNDMVAKAPDISKVIEPFLNFVKDSIMVAHNAPFDMGFLAADFEKFRLPFPKHPVLCSCLLSRTIFPKSTNHRLQTLIKYLDVPQGTAHRALDDAKACLDVALKGFEKLGPMTSLQEIYNLQTEKLTWEYYSLVELRKREPLKDLFLALDAREEVVVRYDGGSKPNQPRAIRPIGIVRNPRGDFVIALCSRDNTQKRFFLDKINL
jgi:DNA polymerase-3 subunit epsilon